MTVTRLEPDKKSRIKVFIDYEYAFFLYDNEIDTYKLEEANVIDTKLYEEIMETSVYPRAREKALSILGYTDRSESELRNKLAETGYTGNIISKVIDYVKSYGYIDDERYASAFIRYQKQTKSKLAIVTKLSQKGINKEIIDKVMCNEYHGDDNEDAELIAIKKAIDKKSCTSENLDYAQKQKLIASLYRKGFDLNKIKKVIG